MTYSDVLASIALAVSLLTAGWAALRALRWDRPVVWVSGQQWIGGRSAQPDALLAGFSIELVNTGNQRTQIIDAYWQIDRGNGVDIHFKAIPGGGGIDSLFLDPRQVAAPTLPLTLDRNERLAWDFEMGVSGISEPEGILRARPVAQYVSRKRAQFAYGRWQPSQIAAQAQAERPGRS